jgi:Plant specific mitochondrial import receptor subunit TOM20
MSLIASFTKKSKLNATIKQTAQARKSGGSTADDLFKAAYQGYAEVLQDDPLRADALYNWGFALLHQAKTKTGDEAARIYQDAIDKFAFCMLINPDYLGSAINGGVAYMDLARLKKVKPDDKLYEMAKKQFEKANAIQAGTASYNLACIYGLRSDKDACLKALENARDKVTLPEAGDILNDPDLDSVKEQDWFVEFMETLNKKTEAETKEPVAEKALEKKWVLVNRNAASEETISDQDAPAENNPAEEAK